MHPARIEATAILAGGAAGTVARAAIYEALSPEPGVWPWATFAANVAGTLLLAWLLAWSADASAFARYWRPLLGTGFCGALTTFSTFQVETIDLAREGGVGTAAGYATASVAVGMLAATGATRAARRRRAR